MFVRSIFWQPNWFWYLSCTHVVCTYDSSCASKDARSDTYFKNEKNPTRVESVEIDADEKAGQVVEPASEMQVSDMVNATPDRKSVTLFLTFALPSPVPQREGPVDWVHSRRAAREIGRNS